jgi:hypothetical protein
LPSLYERPARPVKPWILGDFTVPSIRQEKLHDTQQKAVHDILMGDFKSAEDAISEAEDLGAPEEWVQWRRGQIAYHNGEWEEAIRLLEPAAAKMPNNLALNWLLVRVYWVNHQDDKEREIERRIDALPPSQEEEYLYKGIGRNRASTRWDLTSWRGPFARRAARRWRREQRRQVRRPPRLGYGDRGGGLGHG